MVSFSVFVLLGWAKMTWGSRENRSAKMTIGLRINTNTEIRRIIRTYWINQHEIDDPGV